VKLLLDESLSPILTDLLAGIYTDTAQVCELGLKPALDPQVWAHAASHG
jgi:predicted nuclease of predicted toxin-antitoxin system